MATHCAELQAATLQPSITPSSYNGKNQHEPIRIGHGFTLSATLRVPHILYKYQQSYKILNITDVYFPPLIHEDSNDPHSNMHYFPRISPNPSKFPQNLEQLSIFNILPIHTYLSKRNHFFFYWKGDFIGSNLIYWTPI